MASSASPLDREAQSARETIVSAYASTLAASPETHGRIPASRDVVCRTCTPPGRRDPSGSERLTTGVGAAWVLHGMSWDGPRAAAGQVSKEGESA